MRSFCPLPYYISKEEKGKNLGEEIFQTFRNIKVKNSEYEGLTIMGDLYLNQAIIQGGIDLTQAFIGGNLDLSVICVQNSVDLTLADIGNVLFLRDALIKGDLILNETKYKKMIKHFI